jgi:hypothetical protein
MLPVSPESRSRFSVNYYSKWVGKVKETIPISINLGDEEWRILSKVFNLNFLSRLSLKES